MNPTQLTALETSAKLLQQPEFLSALPPEKFQSLPIKYLFAELSRVDKLLVCYDQLILDCYNGDVHTSLVWCQEKTHQRYRQLRVTLSHMQQC